MKKSQRRLDLYPEIAIMTQNLTNNVETNVQQPAEKSPAKFLDILFIVIPPVNVDGTGRNYAKNPIPPYFVIPIELYPALVL